MISLKNNKFCNLYEKNNLINYAQACLGNYITMLVQAIYKLGMKEICLLAKIRLALY